MRKAIFLFIFILSSACSYADELIFSDDLGDILSRPTPSELNAIGETDKLEAILDLRGFFPMVFTSKKKRDYQASGIFTFFTDIYQWYKLPTKTGVGIFYYNVDLESKNRDSLSEQKLSDVKMLREGELSGEYEEWARLSYEITKDGKNLYESVGGGSGLEASEPVLVLLAKQTSIVFVNFRYRDIDRKGTGQYLAAFEFSRALKKYKACYVLYSTFFFSRSTREAFETSLPIIKIALSLVFKGLR